MRTLLLPLLVLSLSALSVRADTAFFTLDGSAVIGTPYNDSGYLLRVELASGKVEKLPLAAGAEKDDVTSLCRGSDGEALLTTAAGVFVQDAKGTRKLADSPTKADWTIDGLAAAPTKAADVGDWLFLSGSPQNESPYRVFYSRKPGTKGFKEVFCRRTQRVTSGVFTAGGRFFFSGEGDLWEGSFTPFEGGDERDAVLNGARFAPLAIANTDEANGGNLWVHQIMPVGSHLYVLLHGRHMTELLRVPMPAKTPDSGMTTQESYRLMQDSLAKTEVIHPGTDDELRLCTVDLVNGKETVFYRVPDGEGNSSLYLWEYGAAKARKVAVDPK